MSSNQFHVAPAVPAAPSRLLPPTAVAERLAVSRSMVYALVRRGDLPATYVGRLPRIAEVDLAAYIERQRCQRGPEL
jgi:excisionase family DNA binding protein